MTEEFMRLKDGTLLTAEKNRDATLGRIFYRPLTDEEPKYVKLGFILLSICNIQLFVAVGHSLF